MATLEADEHLKQMRFDLVPKQYVRQRGDMPGYRCF